MTTQKTFLPKNYKLSNWGGEYLKLKQGKNEIRILSNSIIWRINWEDKKPIKTKDRQKPIDPDRKPREFWAFAVWSYEDNCIVSAEFTQTSIKQAIMDLYNNEKRGDPKEYDLTINKIGEWMDTKYTIQPSPKTELSKLQKEELEKVRIDMEAVFDWWEPIEELMIGNLDGWSIEVEKEF